MEHTLKFASDQATAWLNVYGNWAVIPALLVDPGGIPWLWVFVMLFAEKAGKNVLLLLIMGMLVLTAFDHALYWLGLKGGRPLINKLGRRFPKFADAVEGAEAAVRGRGVWAIVLGRFLPLVGRYVGIAAGLVRVPYACFAIYDAIGASITVIGFGILAHFVGDKTIDQPWFPTALAIAFIGGLLVTTVATVIGLRHRKATPESS